MAAHVDPGCTVDYCERRDGRSELLRRARLLRSAAQIGLLEAGMEGGDSPVDGTNAFGPFVYIACVFTSDEPVLEASTLEVNSRRDNH